MLMTWRQLFAQLIEKPSERKRVAKALGIRGAWTTFDRWIAGTARPRPYHLKKLPELFPGHEEELKRLISEEFPGLWPVQSKHIPSEFYARVVSANYGNREPLASWATYQLAMLQLQSQIAREVDIAIFKCVPPASGTVQTLYMLTGMASCLLHVPPLRLYGGESLAGRAVQGNDTVVQGKKVAVPLKRRGLCGGTLLVCCPGVVAPWQTSLVQEYAALISLALRYDECYERIALLEIPATLKQEELFLGHRDFTIFREREAEIVHQAEALLLRTMKDMQDAAREQVRD